MNAAPNAVHAAIEYTLRQDRGRLIAALTAVIGDFALAEECLQDAITAALENYQPYHAACADMLRRLGQKKQAKVAYEKALELTEITSDRAFLQDRIRELGLS